MRGRTVWGEGARGEASPLPWKGVARKGRGLIWGDTCGGDGVARVPKAAGCRPYGHWRLRAFFCKKISRPGGGGLF